MGWLDIKGEVSGAVGAHVVDAVVVQLPPVYASVAVGVHLVEERLEVLLHLAFVKEPVAPQFGPDPVFELVALQNVVPVGVVLLEDVLNEALAILVGRHSK